MKKTETGLLDCYLIEPNRFGDDRGYFSPYFIQNDFAELGFRGVVQASRSMSSKGVLRGLHFQKDPKCQAKLVEVIAGAAIDVVVDIRKNSASFGKYTAVLLTPDNNTQLFVPRGFAHGFLALEDHTVFQYLIDNDYAPELEGGILYNDPAIGIPWDQYFRQYGISEPLLSPKDLKHRPLEETAIDFRRG
jgi:dTDP-4-dehydrorhamnose 3,5-epimerase